MPSLSISRRAAIAIELVPVLAFAAWMELGMRAALARHSGLWSVLAGSMPNCVAVVLTALLFGFVHADRADSTPFKLTAMSMIVMVGYEVAQIWMPGRTFDLNDIAASVIGGFIVFPLLRIAHRLTASDPT